MQNQDHPRERFPARKDGRELSALQLRILRAIADAAGADGRAYAPPDILAEAVGVSIDALRDELWELLQQSVIRDPLETFPGDLLVLELCSADRQLRASTR